MTNIHFIKNVKTLIDKRNDINDFLKIFITETFLYLQPLKLVIDYDKRKLGPLYLLFLIFFYIISETHI